MERYHNTATAEVAQGANLAVAKEWAAHGFPVMPLRYKDETLKNGEKRQAKSPRWTNYAEKATTDPTQIERVWSKEPDLLVGVLTGPGTGLAVVDLDRHGEKDGFAALEDQKIECESDFVARTAGDGEHRIFANVPGVLSSNGKVAPGIDVKSETATGTPSYIVAPGTVAPWGCYEWVKGDIPALAKALKKKTLPPIPETMKSRKGSSEPRKKSNGEKSGLPFDEIADALAAIPNDGSTPDMDSRDSWLQIGMGLHHETDGEEEGRELFHEWSAQHPSYDAAKTDAAWDSFRGGGRTAATILREARRHGWHNALGHERQLDEAELLLDECWTPRELAIKAAEAFDAETHTAIEEMVGIPTGSTFFKPVSDWAGLPVPPRTWHVEDLIPGNTVTILGGDGGTGKSLLALQLAVATATGAPWIGLEIDRPGKALVLSAEDDDEELQRRVADICKAQGLNRSSLGMMLVRSTAGEETLLARLDGKTNTLKATRIYKSICASMKREKPTLLVLDTLADLHAGNENDRAHARQFIGLLRHLAIEYQCAVVLLAHPSLTGMNSGSGLSGSTAWNASVRSRLYLKRVKDDGYEADPDARTLETMKANYGPTGGAIALTWMNGVFVPDLPGDDREDRNAKAERVFLKLLTEFTKNGRRVSPKNGSNLASKVFSEHPDREGVSKKAFKTAMECLITAGKIIVEEDGPPSKRSQYLVGA